MRLEQAILVGASYFLSGYACARRVRVAARELIRVSHVEDMAEFFTRLNALKLGWRFLSPGSLGRNPVHVSPASQRFYSIVSEWMVANDALNVLIDWFRLMNSMSSYSAHFFLPYLSLFLLILKVYIDHSWVIQFNPVHSKHRFDIDLAFLTSDH